MPVMLNMEMPKSCFVCYQIKGVRLKTCPIHHAIQCRRYDEVDPILETDDRHKDCPFIEVSGNGRLVKAEEVQSKMSYYGFHAVDMTIHEFVEDELTTIVEV